MPGSGRRSGPAGGSRPRALADVACARRAARRAPRWWAGSVKVSPPAKTRRWREASSPVSSADRGDLGLARRGPRPADRPGAGRASSRCGRSAGRAAGGTRIDEAAVAVGQLLGQRAHPRVLGREALGDDRPGGCGGLRRVDPLAPAIELVLEVERGWRSAARPRSCRGRSGGRARARPWPGSRRGRGSTQPTASWPQKAAKRSVGRPPPAWIAPSRSQTSFSGSAPSRVEAAAHPPGDVGKLLREDERAGEGARVGQLGGDDEAAAGLAVADRDLRASARRGRTGRARRGGRRCAGRCAAAAGSAAAARAAGRRGSSCRPR